jgi:SRSO17 transposase
VTVKEQPPAAGFGHTLLIRRSREMRKRKGRPSSYDIEFFLVHAPVATTMAAMVRAAGLRWKIEEDNKIGKDQLGMDAYQVRKWTPRYRHVTMCMLAQAEVVPENRTPGFHATRARP